MSGVRHLYAEPFARLVFALSLLGAAVIGFAGCGGGSAPTGILPPADDTIAQGDGVTVSGPPQAVPAGIALDVDALSRTQASVYSGLSGSTAMASAARIGRPGMPLRTPVTVTVALAYQVFPATSLELYTRSGNRWRPTYRQAPVSQSGSAVAYVVDRCGEYALVFDRSWCRAASDGVHLIQTVTPTDRTDIGDATVVAAGDKDDAPLLGAVMSATGYSQSQATDLLSSYDDAGPREVKVLALNAPTSVVRYSTSDSRYGRWFAPTDGNGPLSPAQARAAYALPQSNSAHVASLVSLQAGARVVWGICADMSAEPAFGAYATGGGEQFFAPTATLYPPARWNPKVAVPVSALRFPEP